MFGSFCDSSLKYRFKKLEIIDVFFFNQSFKRKFSVESIQNYSVY